MIRSQIEEWMKDEGTLQTLSPFWFWNDRIEAGEVARQMELMAAAGAKQPVIHARNGLRTEYLSEEWFCRMEHAVDTAEKLGIHIWLYDEEDWPSGTCRGTVPENKEYREHFLLIEEQELRTGEKLRIREHFPDIEELRIINATVYETDEGRGDNITGSFASYTARRPCRVYLVREAVNTYEKFGRRAVDYLNEDAIGSFIGLTHERYKLHFEEKFGNVIEGIFTDETRFLNALPWTGKFAETFYEIKGYDIVPLLHLLYRQDEESGAVRCDYFDVVSRMLQKNTFRQLYEWCDRNHLKLIAHVLGEETLAAQARFNGDIMRAYRYLHVPAIDHLGNGIGSLNAKLCVSAAHNYGHLTVASESFGACGWDMTCEELIKVSNWLFQQGINLIIIHGFYYSIRGERSRDWPPSYFFQWKDWEKLPAYAAMQRRMSALQQGTVNDTEILIYYPVETFWSCSQPSFETITCYYKEGPAIEDSQAARVDQDFQYLCSTLLNANYDFELVNGEAADCFRTTGGVLQNIHTGKRYSVLILPKVEYIPSRMVRLINDFSKEGGRVICYDSALSHVLGENGEHMRSPESLPVPDMGNYLKAGNAQEVLELCRRYAIRHFRILKGTDCLTRTQMAYPARLHDPYLHDGEQQYGVGVAAFCKEGLRILNITNYNDREEEIILETDSLEEPVLMDPQTGRTGVPEVVECLEHRYRVRLVLPANRTLYLAAEVGF